MQGTRPVSEENDYFTLFDFSAKFDMVPTMLCQNHTKTIKGFYGQTTAFRKQFIKNTVLIMGESKALEEKQGISMALTGKAHGHFMEDTTLRITNTWWVNHLLI
jgi:hypothetical protein